MALTIEQFGQSIKRKYPQYNDMPDAELGKKMLAKYPQYSDMVNVGIETPATKKVEPGRPAEKEILSVPATTTTAIEPMPVDIKPAPAPAAPTTEAAKSIPLKPMKVETAVPENKNSLADDNENIDDSVWKPDTKLKDIAKNAAATNAAGNVVAPKTPAATQAPSETSSFYREQVESAPAANIRAFPVANLPENNKSATSSETLPATKKIIRGPDESAALGQLPDSPAPGNWENRWDQIKKTTTPGAMPAIANTGSPQPEQEQIVIKTGKNKTLARVLVILALVGIIGIILVVVLTKNTTPAVVKSLAGGNATTTSPGKKTGTAEPTTGDNTKTGNKQPSYLAVVSTVPIYSGDPANVPNLLSPYLQTSLGTTGYYRISILDKSTNTNVGLRQFFSIYKVNAPLAFFNSVNDDFTLFIYSNNGKNRLGFVTPVTNAESVKTTMQSWEGSMQQDTDGLFKLLGRKTQDPQKTLRFTANNAENGTEYRSMVFLPETDNFSLNWAIYNNKYLVFATSADALKKVFDQLPK